MRKFVVALVLALSLCGCSAVKSLQAESDSQMPYRNHQTHFVTKPYKILGRVRGEYSRWCFLLDVVCFGDEFVYDDLLKQGQKQGANEVINIMRMDFPTAPGHFCSQHCSVRQYLAIVVMVSIFVQFPAVPLAKALQFFPSWHRISLRIIASGVVRILITYGRCARRFGAADQ